MSKNGSSKNDSSTYTEGEKETLRKEKVYIAARKERLLRWEEEIKRNAAAREKRLREEIKRDPVREERLEEEIKRNDQELKRLTPSYSQINDQKSPTRQKSQITDQEKEKTEKSSVKLPPVKITQVVPKVSSNPVRKERAPTSATIAALEAKITNRNPFIEGEENYASRREKAGETVRNRIFGDKPHAQEFKPQYRRLSQITNFRHRDSLVLSPTSTTFSPKSHASNSNSSQQGLEVVGHQANLHPVTERPGKNPLVRSGAYQNVQKAPPSKFPLRRATALQHLTDISTWTSGNAR